MRQVFHRAPGPDLFRPGHPTLDQPGAVML